MPPATGSPPASATIAASADRAVASRTWPGRSAAVSGGTTSSPVEKIATRGRACTVTLGDAGRRQHAEVLGAQRPAGGHQLGAERGVLVGAHDAVAGRDRPDHLDRARHRLLRCTRS